MPTFTGSSWTSAAADVELAADDFYTGAHPVTVQSGITGGASTMLDPAIEDGDKAFVVPWHELIANAVEAMYIDASKMRSTGENYEAMEEEGTSATDRFWGGV